MSIFEILWSVKKYRLQWHGKYLSKNAEVGKRQDQFSCYEKATNNILLYYFNAGVAIWYLKNNFFLYHSVFSLLVHLLFIQIHIVLIKKTTHCSIVDKSTSTKNSGDWQLDCNLPKYAYFTVLWNKLKMNYIKNLITISKVANITISLIIE